MLARSCLRSTRALTGVRNGAIKFTKVWPSQSRAAFAGCHWVRMPAMSTRDGLRTASLGRIDLTRLSHSVRRLPRALDQPPTPPPNSDSIWPSGPRLSSPLALLLPGTFKERPPTHCRLPRRGECDSVTSVNLAWMSPRVPLRVRLRHIWSRLSVPHVANGLDICWG